MIGLSQRIINPVIDVLLPPSCLSCDAPVTGTDRLCEPCRDHIHFLRPPLCTRCGVEIVPPSRSPSSQSWCLPCLGRRKDEKELIEIWRAIFRYDTIGRKLILALKYGDRLDAAPVYGQWMAGAGLSPGRDMVIVPVPLHRKRLWHRRYNQAAVLAQHIARNWHKPVWVDALIRQSPTRPQINMSARQRRRNVAHAFAMNPRRHTEISGKYVVLVDDVITSGATVEACARVLHRAGVSKVCVLALADARPTRGRRSGVSPGQKQTARQQAGQNKARHSPHD